MRIDKQRILKRKVEGRKKSELRWKMVTQI